MNIFPGLSSGMVSIEGMWDTLRADEKFEQKFNDALFAINGGIVVIGSILVPVAAPVLLKLGAAYSVVEVGVATNRFMTANDAQNQMESTAALGVGSNVGGVQYYDQWVTSEGWGLALTIGFAGLDLASLKGVGSMADEAAALAFAKNNPMPSEFDSLFPKDFFNQVARQGDGAASAAGTALKGTKPLTNLPAGSPPTAFSRWIAPNGQAYEVLEKLGEGLYSTVYRLGGENAGQVIKIAKTNADTSAARAAEKVTEASEISQLLAENGIPQVRVLDAFANPNGTSFLVTELLPEGAQMVKQVGFEGMREALIKAGKWSADHERAIAELYDSLASKGLVWLDGHLENLYFFKDAAGKLKAGILDHDMIANLKQLDEAMEIRVQDLFLRPQGLGIDSLANIPLGQRMGMLDNIDPYQVMALAMEAKGLIKFADDAFGTLRMDPTALKNFDGFAPFINPNKVNTDGLLDFTAQAGRTGPGIPSIPVPSPTTRAAAGTSGQTATGGLDEPDWDGSKTDFSWSSLTDDTPLNEREINDIFTDGIISDSNASDFPDRAIFADGFESGDVSNWSR